MKIVISTVCILVLAGALCATDKKAKGRGAWAWASACSECQAPAKAPEAAKTEDKPAQTKPAASVTVVETGSCANGQCGTTRVSRGLFRRGR